jgi:hypothetical protein
VDVAALRENSVANAAENGILGADGGDNVNQESERQKILNGTYPSRVVQGRQNKHIEGTREFEQNREQMNRLNPGSSPAILDVDAQTMVENHKGTGTGRIYFSPSSPSCPREDIVSESAIGRTWIQSQQRYVNTRAGTIIYSGKGTHVVPVNERGRL